MIMQNKILMAIPYAYLESMAGVRTLCTVLSSENYTVKILTINNEYFVTPTFDDKNISIEFMPTRYRGIKSGATGALFLLMYLLSYFKKSIRQKPRVHVGIGLKGGVAAVLVARLLRQESAYYAMELYCTDRNKSWKNNVYAKIEWLVCKLAQAILIQDDRRAGILINNYGLESAKILILPNSPYLNARRHKNNFLHSEHGIPENNKILLYIGSLSDTCRVAELVEGFQNAPDTWTLVIHSKWNGFDEVIGKSIDKLRALDVKKRVIIRTNAVSADELTSLVDSADIGVALYGNDSMNVNEVGLSSGKIGHYLASGLPVIVSNQESLNVFSQECRSGLAIDNCSELTDALSRIIDDYENYSRRSIACFNKYYSIDIYSTAVIQAFSDLISP